MADESNRPRFGRRGWLRARITWSHRRRHQDPRKEFQDNLSSVSKEKLHVLPDSVWLAVFSYLHRSAQNSLVEAHRGVWMSRDQLEFQWPTGLNVPRRGVFSVDVQGDHLVTTLHRSKSVHLYHKRSGPQKTKMKHQAHIVAAKFSPDQSLLATISKNGGTICFWNTGTWDCVQTLSAKMNDPRHIIWSPCSRYVACWSEDGSLLVQSLESDQHARILWKTRLEVVGCRHTVAFTSDSKEVVYAHNNEVIRVWSFATAAVRILPGTSELIHSYAGSYLTAVQFSPDYQTLAVGCHVATLKLWTVTNSSNNDNGDQTDEGTLYDFRSSIRLGNGWSAVTLITFTPDSKYVACTSNGSQIRVVHLETHTVVGSLTHVARVSDLCFSRDGSILVAGGSNRAIRLWRRNDQS